MFLKAEHGGCARFLQKKYYLNEVVSIEEINRMKCGDFFCKTQRA